MSKVLYTLILTNWFEEELDMYDLVKGKMKSFSAEFNPRKVLYDRVFIYLLILMKLSVSAKSAMYRFKQFSIFFHFLLNFFRRIELRKFVTSVTIEVAFELPFSIFVVFSQP